MSTEQTFPQRCVPEQGLYCRPLATRVRAPIHLTMFGFGFVKRVRMESGAPKEEFVGIAYRAGPSDAVLLEFCCFCGTRILREDMAAEHSNKNAGHTPSE